MKNLIEKANARTGIFAKFKPEQRGTGKKRKYRPQSEHTQEAHQQRWPQEPTREEQWEGTEEAIEAEEWLREAMITAHIPD